MTIRHNTHARRIVAGGLHTSSTGELIAPPGMWKNPVIKWDKLPIKNDMFEDLCCIMLLCFFGRRILLVVLYMEQYHPAKRVTEMPQLQLPAFPPVFVGRYEKRIHLGSGPKMSKDVCSKMVVTLNLCRMKFSPTLTCILYDNCTCEDTNLGFYDFLYVYWYDVYIYIYLYSTII